MATLLFQSCRGDSCTPGANDRYISYNIPDSNTAKIPYTGTDTLIFVSDAGDTATLIGQGKNTYYKKKTSVLGCSADCPCLEYASYENVDYVFQGNNNFIQSLAFKIYMPNNAGKPNFTYIAVDLNNINMVQRSFEYVYFNKTPHDSIYIDGKYYSGVYFNDNTSKTLLFSISAGILKFRDFDNKIWIKNH